MRGTYRAAPLGTPPTPLQEAARALPEPSGSLLGVHPLDQRSRPGAAGGAHGDQPELAVGALELVQQRGDEPRAGGAERVSEGERAAVDVDALERRLQL